MPESPFSYSEFKDSIYMNPYMQRWLFSFALFLCLQEERGGLAVLSAGPLKPGTRSLSLGRCILEASFTGPETFMASSKGERGHWVTYYIYMSCLDPD